MSEPAHPAPAQPEGMPVCPRHPDRESWVRCQRCGRPVCPQCQRQAPVGVQCVDCVREGARTVRSARTAFGATMRGTGAPITKVLVGICVAVWLLELARPSIIDDFAFGPVVGWSEPWTVLTGAFLHAAPSPLHLGMNMLVLWMFGNALEPALGRTRFLLTYLVSAVGGAVAIVLLATPPDHVLLGRTSDFAPYLSWFQGTIGASGAIFGLFGAYMVINKGLGNSNSSMWVTLLLNAVIGFSISGISWQGHLGGLITGAACGAVLMLTRDPARRRLAVPGLLAVLVVVVALAAIKYAGVLSIYR